MPVVQERVYGGQNVFAALKSIVISALLYGAYRNSNTVQTSVPRQFVLSALRKFAYIFVPSVQNNLLTLCFCHGTSLIKKSP